MALSPKTNMVSLSQMNVDPPFEDKSAIGYLGKQYPRRDLSKLLDHEHYPDKILEFVVAGMDFVPEGDFESMLKSYGSPNFIWCVQYDSC